MRPYTSFCRILIAMCLCTLSIAWQASLSVAALALEPDAGRVAMGSTASEQTKRQCLSRQASYSVSSIYGDCSPRPAFLSGLNDLIPANLPGTQDFAPEFSFHTKLEANPYTLIDLGRLCDVDKVMVGNRHRQEQARADGLTVWFSQDNVTWQNERSFGPVASVYELAISPPVRCRYVKIGLKDKTNYLHLAHVAVWGVDLSEQSIAVDSKSQSAPGSLQQILQKAVGPSAQSQVIDTGKGVKITVPGGLLTRTETLTVSELVDLPADQNKMLKNERAVDVTLGNLTALKAPLSIEITLPGQGAIGNQLARYYDATAGAWCAVPFVVNKAARTVTINTNHLCNFGICEVSGTYVPRRAAGLEFIVVYDRGEVEAATSSYKRGAPIAVPIPIEDLAHPAYIQDIIAAVKEAGSAYSNAGFAFGNKVMMIFVSGSGNPAHNSITGNISYPVTQDNRLELRRALAHELFHNVERSKFSVPGMIARKWWVEMCAEYAACRLAVPEYRRMGTQDTVVPPYFLEIPLPTAGKTFNVTLADIACPLYAYWNRNDPSKHMADLAKNHEYHSAWFLDFVIERCLALQKKPVDELSRRDLFFEMFKASANDSSLLYPLTPIERVVKANTSSSLEQIYSEFACNFLFNLSSPMSMSDKSKIPEAIICNQYQFKVADPAVDFGIAKLPGHTTGLIKATCAVPMTLMVTGTALPPSTAVYARVLKHDQRISSAPSASVSPLAGTSRLSTTTQKVQMLDGDALYFVVVNSGDSVESVKFTVEPVSQGQGFWMLTADSPVRKNTPMATGVNGQTSVFNCMDGEVIGKFASSYEFRGQNVQKKIEGQVHWASFPRKLVNGGVIKMPIIASISGDIEPNQQAHSVLVKLFAQMVDIRPSHLTVVANAQNSSPAATEFTIAMPALYDKPVKLPITLTVTMPFAGREEFEYTYCWFPPGYKRAGIQNPVYSGP